MSARRKLHYVGVLLLLCAAGWFAYSPTTAPSNSVDVGIEPAEESIVDSNRPELGPGRREAQSSSQSESRSGEEEVSSEALSPNGQSPNGEHTIEIKGDEHYKWRVEGITVDGKREGLWRQFYPTGELYAEIPFVNGLKSGMRRTWSENGVLIEECHFENGIIHGPFNHYYMGGEIAIESHYVDGVLHGEFKMWFRSGVPKEEAMYRQGVLTGMRSVWGEDGNLDLNLSGEYSGGARVDD